MSRRTARVGGRSPEVAVVGGGWAGCAAAVTLAEAGVRAALFEQARSLGGRARRVVLDGMALDNGQHLLVGAYRQTLALLARVHGKAHAQSLLHRLPLTMRPLAGPPARGISLAAWRAPAPLHLAAAVLTARGLGWRERALLARRFRRLQQAGFDCAPGATVAELFADCPPRVYSALWEPLCLAALNTPPARASAKVFLNVLAAAFAGSSANSDFLVPAADLGALLPDAAAAFVSDRGGTVHTGAAVRGVAATRAGAEVRVGARRLPFAAAVVAVGPHQLAATVGGHDAADAWRPILAQTRAFAYESITTVYLGYAGRVDLPARLTRLDDAPGQWVFDRSAALGPGLAADARALLAVVISAGGPHDRLDHATLAAGVDRQLRRLRPGLPALAWSRVIAERRATYACTAGLARAVGGRIEPAVYLAGDYTDPEFPATLEAAVRSGVAAARAVLADLHPAAG
jgi:squalene-associated FAD-dependent desaturase